MPHLHQTGLAGGESYSGSFQPLLGFLPAAPRLLGCRFVLGHRALLARLAPSRTLLDRPKVALCRPKLLLAALHPVLEQIHLHIQLLASSLSGSQARGQQFRSAPRVAQAGLGDQPQPLQALGWMGITRLEEATQADRAVFACGACAPQGRFRPLVALAYPLPM